MSRLKNITPDGVALVPSAFLIDEIVITNKIGQTVDVQNLVTEFSITESLYTPSLFCSLSIKDHVNLLETLPLYGQETIRISVYRQSGENGPQQRISLEFYLTEYPVFGRPKEQHTQVYTIRGISPHAFVNSQRKISRFWRGPTSDQIVKIFQDAFGESVEVEGGAISKGQGIINIQSPMQAADWFRRRTYDGQFAPFYLFQTIDGKINLKSHSVIANDQVYERYIDSRDFNNDVATELDYEARRKRIVDVSSDLNLSKFFASEKGTFASENNYLDISKKSFSRKYYSYPGQFPISSTLEGKSVLESPPPFEVSPDLASTNSYLNQNFFPPAPTEHSEEMGANFFSYMEHIATNSLAFEGSFQNYSTALSVDSIYRLNAFEGIFNTYVHDLILFGDMDLKAGTKIELEFPRAVDPEQVGQADLIDRNLSGKYIVTSAIHEFKNQEYFLKVRVKRDSFSQ